MADDSAVGDEAKVYALNLFDVADREDGPDFLRKTCAIIRMPNVTLNSSEKAAFKTLSNFIVAIHRSEVAG